MKIQYNAPVILSFTFAAVAVVLIDNLLWAGISFKYFALVPGMSFNQIITYIRLFTHVLGHASWLHLVANFTFILLIGPMLEEKYGSKNLLMMMIVTAVSTGILNVLMFNTGLMGASGIAFMMILLASFANFESGKIPLTFIMVLLLFLGEEIFNSIRADNISQFAHLIGGGIGTIYGFYFKRR